MRFMFAGSRNGWSHAVRQWKRITSLSISMIHVAHSATRAPSSPSLSVSKCRILSSSGDISQWKIPFERKAYSRTCGYNLAEAKAALFLKFHPQDDDCLCSSYRRSRRTLPRLMDGWTRALVICHFHFAVLRLGFGAQHGRVRKIIGLLLCVPNGGDEYLFSTRFLVYF